MIAVIDGRNFLFITCYKYFPQLNKNPELIDIDDALETMKYALKSGIEDLLMQWDISQFYIVFDGNPSFRKKIYEGYKSTRLEKKELIQESERLFIEEWSKEFKWKVVQQDSLEGDDWMAIISKDKKNDYLLVTGDEDMHQLTIYDNVWVLALVKKKVFGKKLIDMPNWLTFEQCDGYQTCYKKIWLGCSSDDIPKLLPRGKSEKFYENNFSQKWLKKSYQDIIDSEYEICEFIDINADDVYRNFSLTCLLHEYHPRILSSWNIKPIPHKSLINNFNKNSII